MDKAIILDNITVSYARHPAVHHVSGSFDSGSLTAIAGPNGAGKSTLLKAIAGIVTPDEGRILLQTPKEQIAYLPQAADMQRDFPMSVLHMVCTGYWHKAGWFGTISSAQRLRASEALTAVGLRGFEKRELASLSVGQFQRALFARVIVQDASIILLDEPFNAIDADTTAQLLELIQRWHKEKRTVICVLHDFAMIRNHFPDCLLLARECIAWDKAEKALHPEHLLGARFFRDGWNSNPEICDRAV